MLFATLLAMGRGVPAMRQAETEWELRTERASAMIRHSASLQRPMQRGGGPFDPMRPEEWAHVGETPTAAAAEAMSEVSDLAHLLDATVLAVRPESDSAFRDGTATVVLHLQLAIDAEGLRTLIERLETGPRLFRVRALSITQPEVVAVEDVREQLRVELSVESAALHSSGQGGA